MVTVEQVQQEIERPLIIAQVSDGSLHIKLTYFPDTRLYETKCYAGGSEDQNFCYNGRVAYNAVKTYNEAYAKYVKNK